MQHLSEWMRDYLNPISMAIVATILVIFGNDLNRWIRKMVRQYHFLVRLSVFILVCAFGYGVATVLLAKLLADVLGSISDYYLSLVVAAIFVILGLTAEERNQM